MLTVRLRIVLTVAGIGFGWTFMAPAEAAAQTAVCTYVIAPSTVSNVNGAGGSGSLRVGWTQTDAPLGIDLRCGDNWAPSSSHTWLSLTTSDTDNSVLNYTVAANNTSAARTATITVGGATATITQLAGPCHAPTVSPTEVSFTSDGGMESLTVTQAAATCTYGVSSNKDWIRLSSSTVAGGRSVTVTVGMYDGTTPGSGTVTIGPLSVPVMQSGVPPPPPPPPCSTPTITPPELTFSSGAGSKTVTVSGSDCDSLPVRDNQAWISVPGTVSNGGTMTVFVTENTGTGNRTGTVTIHDASLTVTQTDRPPPPNLWPVAVDDAATTQTNTAVAISVLANDTDADNDSLSVTAIVQSPTQGTATVAADKQTITYTPPTDWTGTATFTYRVSDGNRGTDEATVTVTVSPPNRPPTANAGRDRTAAVGAIVRLNGALSADPDGDSLQYQWTQTSGTEVLFMNSTQFYRTTTEFEVTFKAPATPGDDDLEFSLVVTDEHGSASEPATVTVTVLGAVLTQHRERLLADLASRGGRTGGVCALWNNLHRTQKEVFLWNTHRLHITGMLSDVTKLHAVYGRDRGACGGGEYNRTFMSMTPALRDKLVLIARDQNRTVLPEWRETMDPACTWVAQIAAAVTGTIVRLGECPHQPFTAQIETFAGGPRGQIQFFGPDYVIVSREYGPGGGFDSCSVDRIGVPRSDVCPAGTTCPGGGPYTDCATEHSDTIEYDPTGPYTRGPAGDTVTISDAALSFEMDQDYGFTHNSAPSCNNMRMTYSELNGDPNWQWRPTGCSPPMGVTEPEPDPVGARSIRAVHVTELRQRVNALRQRFGLSVYTWTDATITPEVTPVKAVHVTEVRTALNEAYRAANRDTPQFTDAVITPRVTPIRQVHFQRASGGGCGAGTVTHHMMSRNRKATPVPSVTVAHFPGWVLRPIGRRVYAGGGTIGSLSDIVESAAGSGEERYVLSGWSLSTTAERTAAGTRSRAAGNDCGAARSRGYRVIRRGAVRRNAGSGNRG